jgi:hypothetical protein
MVKRTIKQIEEDLSNMTEDEAELLIDLIRLDLAGEGLVLPPLDCGSCTGEKGCC